MKHLFIPVLVVITFLAGCQNQPETAATGDNSMPDSSAAGRYVDTSAHNADSTNTVSLENGMHCFAYIKNQDTISMQLELKDTVASGNLIFNFYEKDKNKGTFKGFLRNDTLLADYTFSSEGMRSVRQVVFLLKGDILLSGSGSMKEQKNRLVFSNKKDITFDNNLVLKSIDCNTATTR